MIRPEWMRNDPAASEVFKIRTRAAELEEMCDAWLTGREAQHQRHAEEIRARELRAEAELARGGR